MLLFCFAGTNRFSWNESLAFYEFVYKDKDKYVTLSDMMKHLQDLNREVVKLQDVLTFHKR